MTATLDPVDVQPSPTPTPLQRPAPRARKPQIRLAALRAPLAVKVIGAHLGVVAALSAIVLLWWGSPPPAVLAGAAIVLTLIYVVLVVIALRPIHDLEAAASRIWRGDYGTRVDPSALADQDVLRVGSMFNLLLDGLAADRARLRRLATEVIRAGDRERAALARELHDSAAQRLAGVMLHLDAAVRDTTDDAVRERLAEVRDETRDILEDLRVLSHTVHPRVLDDLGLPAALHHLARETQRASELEIDVAAPAKLHLPAPVASALYRVAQEAVRNVTRHSRARHATIVLSCDDGRATLSVTDDGAGFDVAEAARRREGMGLFNMRERIELVDGTFTVTSGTAEGTTVRATVPTTERESI